MSRWTRANLRHVAQMFRLGRNPAAGVYESIGSDLPLTLADGWLNLGLWDSAGDPAEAERAPGRLVETLASEVPRGGSIVDVGNGLGVQDPVIAAVAHPALLTAVNITEMHLRAGSAALAEARAHPVCADACTLPLADRSADGVISVEAAFHFPSRARFFAEAYRVLRPGGVLSMSDVSMEHAPRSPAELAAGLLNLRFWGVRTSAGASAGDIARLATDAGFTDVTITPCGARTIDPFVAYTRARLRTVEGLARGQRTAARTMLWSWEALRARPVIDYILLRARKP